MIQSYTKKFGWELARIYVKQIAKKAGIKKNATLHKFRHSFSSHLSQMGVDSSVRQFLLGHAPQSITDHYTKLDASKLSVVVSKLDALVT